MPPEKDRLTRILKYHFDLELLLKMRECKLIELELERGREIRACLEKLLVNEVVYPDRFTRQEYQLFTGSSASGGSTSGVSSVSSTTISTTSNTTNTNTVSLKRVASMPSLHASPSDNRHQYEIRADGTIVKLQCPQCAADKFKSMLGFLNHCRIHCHVLFTSPEDRQQRAGVVMDPASVPADFFTRHPSILKQEQDLAAIRSDLQPVFETQQLLSPDPTKESASVSEERWLAESEPLAGEVTRFCIHKRVIIGNEARCLRQGEGKHSQSTHQFRLFLRAPPVNIAGQKDNLSRWIRFVRFHLHPSFAESVVDKRQEPFELSLETFGEFPVRLQLHFWDAKRNPPFDIIHHVKVFHAVNPGRTVAGPERMYEVELDRCTDFAASLLPFDGSAVQSSADVGRSIRSDYDILQRALIGQQSTLPIMSTGSGPSALEQAKLAICEGLLEQIRLRNAQFCLSAKEILSWISNSRPDYFQQTKRPEEGATDSSAPRRFCFYCGQCHEPVERFEVLQKNCSFKPRRIRLNSKTELSSFVLGRYAMSDGPMADDTRYCNYNLKSLPSTGIRWDQYGVSEDPHFYDSMVESVHDSRMSKEARMMCNALTRVFAKRLIAKAITVAHDNGTRPTPTRPVMLTPLHIYCCLTNTVPSTTAATQTTTNTNTSDNLMDFITLENMQS